MKELKNVPISVEEFTHIKFGVLRTHKDANGEIWFVGLDVARALGYSDTNQALRKHVDAEDKLTRRIDGVDQTRHVITINESGLYSLVMGSKLPSAKEFKHWVTHEVLPTIRKTGAYFTTSTIQELKEHPENLAEILEENEKLREQNKHLAAENTAASIIVGAKGGSEIHVLAKEIASQGYKIGRNRLLQWLRDMRILGIMGNMRNWPLQKYIDLGWFKIKTRLIDDGEGPYTINRYVVTNLGKSKIVRLFLARMEGRDDRSRYHVKPIEHDNVVPFPISEQKDQDGYIILQETEAFYENLNNLKSAAGLR